jgi:hypothetical protein
MTISIILNYKKNKAKKAYKLMNNQSMYNGPELNIPRFIKSLSFNLNSTTIHASNPSHHRENISL